MKTAYASHTCDLDAGSGCACGDYENVRAIWGDAGCAVLASYCFVWNLFFERRRWAELYSALLHLERENPAQSLAPGLVFPETGSTVLAAQTDHYSSLAVCKTKPLPLATAL
jgi:hypothetical protein